MINQVLATIDKKLMEAQHITHHSGYGLGTIRVLYCLHRYGPMRVTAIAEKTNITQQAVGKKLTQLASEGMVGVELEADDIADGRARPMGLTAKGVKALRKIAGVWK